jgi:hypothetical protein
MAKKKELSKKAFLQRYLLKYGKLKYKLHLNELKKKEKLFIFLRKKQKKLLSIKHFKNIKHVFSKKRKDKKKKLLEYIKPVKLVYNRILYIHPIYDKNNKNYFYFNNKLKKLKKRKKTTLNKKLNIYL